MTDVCPIPRSDGCDCFGLGDEFLPGLASVIHYGLVVFEDAV